ACGASGRDRWLHAADAADARARVRADRVRGRRGRRTGLAVRRADRVDADRHPADVRGRRRLFAARSAPRAWPRRFPPVAGPPNARRQACHGRADRAVPAPRADADRAPARPSRNARRMKDPHARDKGKGVVRCPPRGRNSRSGAALRAHAPLRGLVVLVVALALLPHVPGLDTDFGRSLWTQMAIAAVFALSLNLLFGQTGLLSFA